MKPKILIAAVLFFCFLATSFAATQFMIGTVPVTAVVSSGKTERTGDLVFVATGPGDTVPGTITITYPVPVSYIPSNAIQDLVIDPGDPGTNLPTISNPAYVDGSQNMAIRFSITPNATSPALHYSFRLSGIRVDVSDNPGATPMNALLYSLGNTIVVGQTDPRVIQEQSDGIGSFTGSASVRVNAASGVIDGSNNIQLTATEGFWGAFGVTTFSDPTQLNTQRLEIRLNSQIPAGVTITFPATDSSGCWQLVPGYGGPLTNASGSSPRVYYEMIQDTNFVAFDTFQLASVTIAVTPGAYAGQTLNASISLAPVFDETVPTGSDSAVPRYAYAPVGSVPLVEFFAPITTLFDVDGDLESDIAVWRPDSGTWYVLPSTMPDDYASTPWGMLGDAPVAGDYDGDGKADIAVWRPDSGTWYVLPSSTPGDYMSTSWGMPGDTPVAGDYDGDGKADIAIWRPDSGIWYVLPSNAPGDYVSTPWGMQGDTPVAGDYDGDGKSDIAVWRPDSGIWYVLPSSTPGDYASISWGMQGDIPVPGDYDGDGLSDIAVWRPDSGTWYVLPSSTPGDYESTQWGMLGDTPVPGDYDGDGLTDFAVWRQDSGRWFILSSSVPGDYTVTQWGMEEDVVIP
jgi:hypothetical protein